MSNRRTQIMAGAALIAVLSGLLLYFYVSGIEKRAEADAGLVPVWTVGVSVAKGTPAGDAIVSGAFKKGVMPRKSLPVGLVGELKSLEGRVAAHELIPGTILLDPMFVAPETVKQVSNKFSDRIPKGRVAVSFTVAADDAVAGLVVPGDLVNLMIQTPVQTRPGLCANVAGEGADQLADPAIVTVFQNVEVVAIGAAVAPQAGTTATTVPGAPPVDPNAPVQTASGSLTVLVNPEDAPRLLYLTRGCRPYLSLVPMGNEAKPLPIISDENALPTNITP